MSVLEQIPDSLKLAAATCPTVLHIWGYPVEQWMYVVSAVVSIMFIIEKSPVVIKNIKMLINYVKFKKP